MEVVEALLLTFIVAFLMAIVAVYAASVAPHPGDFQVASVVDASLCGNLLYVHNYGPGTVKVTSITLVVAGNAETLTVDKVIAPGGSWNATLPYTPDEVVIAGVGFEALRVVNSCS